MPRIPITDSTGVTVDLDFADASDAARLGLSRLASTASAFVHFLDDPLDKTAFRSAVLGGDYQAPEWKLSGGATLAVKTGVNTSLHTIRSTEEAAERELPFAAGEIWVAFGIEVVLKLSTGVSASGFGVSGAQIAVHSATTYTRFSSSGGAWPSVRDAVAKAISNFRLRSTAAQLREQPTGTAFEWEVTGKFVLEGSYAYPCAANAFSLVTAKLPLKNSFDVAPELELQLAGALAVSGEFRTRVHRLNDAALEIGLYKKKETELTAAFTAEAGLGASIGSADLLSALFRALGSEKFDAAQLPEADRKALQDSFGSALGQGLSVALNLECSAVRADESAILYQVDLASNSAAVNSALDQALAGNWSALAGLPQARALKTLLARTRETGFQSTLNLLGFYDCVSIDDFARQCSILYGIEDGTVTITDRESAQRISAAAQPFIADDHKLRKVIEESFLATVTYSAANPGSPLRAEQKLLVYRARQNYAALRKDLRLGEALRLLDAQDLNAIPAQPEFRFYRLSASAVFAGDDAARLFFADPAARTPHNEEDLKRLGREVLISLLDENNPVDAARIAALRSDAVWAQMEAQHFPPNSPASYSDWYDIANWARTIAGVAPKLKAVLDAWAAVSGDPSQNARFMSARDALASALAEVTRNTHAAFERGWPVAAMYALGGFRAPVTLTAQWNGAQQIEKRAGQVLRAV